MDGSSGDAECRGGENRCLPVRRDSAVTRLLIHSSRRGGATDQHFVVIVLQWNAVIDAAMANRREIKHRGG